MTDLSKARKELPDDPFQALQEVLRQLRAPGGCPWDRKQTHKSLIPHLLEEAHEVVEAIDHEDWAELCGELGDLQMHILFQVQMAEESDRFSLDDVLEGIIRKLIRRHPHVFSDLDVEDEGEVIRNWEQMKMEEGRESAVEGVPTALPALIRAFRVQNKAAQVGFDWDHIDPVWSKVQEEIDELEAIAENGSPEEIEEEFGDLLFSLVNLSRFLHINAEDALRGAVRKFIRRFQEIERRVSEENGNLQQMSLEEMDAHWNDIKSEE